MRIRNFLCLLAFCFLHPAQAQRTHENFDEGWKFYLGHAQDPGKDFNYGRTTIFKKTGEAPGTAIDPRFNDAGWRTLNLPHDWAVELPFVKSASFDVVSHGFRPVGPLFPETSIGWYRKQFTVDRRDSGQRYALQFDGVFRDAQFWINGIYLGNNKSGYVGVEYDITDFIQFDRANVLVVRVDASQYEGWFYEGAGIYRHVWLNRYSNLHILPDGVFVHSQVSGTNAVLQVETEIENKETGTASCTVTTYLTDRNGKKIVQGKEERATLGVNGKRKITQRLPVSRPRLWSTDDPYLYRVVSLVKMNGRVVDSVQLRVGIRSFRFDGEKGFFLNDRPLKLKGTNNHQDHAGVGSALPDYLQYYRIRLLKQLGSNAYRASHNAPTPELLDACDSLGMLVLDEQRLLNSGAEYMDQFERLVRRDRSRACVFLWSIGNEEGWIHTSATGKRIAQSLLAKQKELDPSRTSTYAADVGNVFRGVNEVIPVRGFNYRDSAVADYHRDHPQQPIIGTEMGSTVTTRGIYRLDTVNAYVPDQDITSPWWAARAEEWWPPAATHDYWGGGFVWTGFDYRGEPTPYEWPNVNSHFGIMDVCGFPKNIYYYYQSWWSDGDVLHLSPHWNWKGREGQEMDVWVNSNADQVELFLNGKSLGSRNMPRNGHLLWKIPYVAGTLEAVGTRSGRQFRHRVETTGAPAEVVVTPYKTTMLADGKDATVINISVVDREGREVPDAGNLIRFSVKGDAKIIGVGNGDPSSHEQDKFDDTAAHRHLFNGKCQVILLAGKNAGSIRFEARSEGLWDGSTDIFSVRPDATPQEVRSLTMNKKGPGAVLGADISFLPELEARGIKFSDKGVQKDALQILKDHGFNYIRLRIFNNPAADSGYSPGKGFCDLAHTLQMARRIRASGMKFLLDFHYSDYWADPGKQFKPAAWKNISFPALRDSVYAFTYRTIRALGAQGTLPDMVQIGNEINHGMLWPEGHVNHLDSLAELIRAGTAAVQQASPSTIMLLHIALGGQNDESVYFLNNMIARRVPFDVIGLSYYPKWHGTLQDLQSNLDDLSRRYQKDLIVVEYSQLKEDVNRIAFSVKDGRGKGSFIWEPLNTWEAVFDREGRSNQFLTLYDRIRDLYVSGKGR